jgi:FSR family fosmidomycin resistance protein-like MFS transporter
MPPIPWRPLAVTVGVMMAINGVLYSIEAFVPTWYDLQGYVPAFYGPLATVLLLAHAVGAVAAGWLADRFGRRRVAIGSLIALAPALWIFTSFSGPIAFVTIALVGLSVAAAGPLLLLTAQQMMAERAGMASGMIMGVGFITGAIGVPITGAFGDLWGLQTALRLLMLVIGVGIALAWFLPDERASTQRGAHAS